MKKVTAPVVERAPLSPSAMTFSELLSGFKALRGAASGDVEVKRFEALVKAGVDVIVVDTAHGHSENVLKTVRAIRERWDIDVIGIGVGRSGIVNITDK